MHIIKNNPCNDWLKGIKQTLFSVCLIGGSASLWAGQIHATEHTHSHQSESPNLNQALSFDQDVIAHHQNQHGGQRFQRTEFETAWHDQSEGAKGFSSELKSWIGTDENKLFIQAELDKEESAKAEYALSLLYSRAILPFWDAQAGLRYRKQSADHELKQDQNRYDLVFGFQGLAPYFFETEAYLYLGQDDWVSAHLETERDFLLTQKWILQPFLKLELVAQDRGKRAKRTGLSSLEAGIESRYEISKKVMPFVYAGYGYSRGYKDSSQSSLEDEEKGGLYGAGIRFKF